MKHLEVLPLECIFLNLKIAFLNRTMEILNHNFHIKKKKSFLSSSTLRMLFFPACFDLLQES